MSSVKLVIQLNELVLIRLDDECDDAILITTIAMLFDDRT